MNNFTKYLDNINLSIQNALPLNFSLEWQTYSFGKLDRNITKEHILELIKPNKNLIDLGGKRWRPLLLILCYERAQKLFGTNTDNIQIAYDLCPLVEFTHTASLIHDDIEDSADLRRGEPSCHITFGIDKAINSASWLYFESSSCIDKAPLNDKTKLDLYKLYTNELRRLHLGQAMDIYWHKNQNVFPAINEYRAMVKNKTGTLASLAAQVGYLIGGATLEQAFDLGQICANIGMGFQIIDDVQNLSKGNVGKKRGDDIVEGKKSLPVLLHINKNPQDKEKIASLFTIAQKEGINSYAVEECINLLEKSGSIKEACTQGINAINENCLKLSDSPLIYELFTSMVPKDLL